LYPIADFFTLITKATIQGIKEVAADESVDEEAAMLEFENSHNPTYLLNPTEKYQVEVIRQFYEHRS
jgi:hypothetical protein